MEKDSVYTHAVKLLAGRDYSVSKLRDKLVKRFADQRASDIEEIISRLRSERYLDDRRFAENFVEIHIDRGRLRLETELASRGIDPSVAGTILDRQEWPTLATVLKSKMKSLKLEPPVEMREAARLFRALQRLGYDEEEVRAELEKHV